LDVWGGIGGGGHFRGGEEGGEEKVVELHGIRTGS
jgi:hypothetical protein